MFVAQLNPSQQQILVNLAYHTMFVDGQLDELELELLMDLKKQCMGQVIEQAVDMDEVTREFTERKDKISLMLELVMVVMADEVCHEAEVYMLDDIANRIGISSKDMDDCKDWVKQFNQVKAQAEQLMKD